MANKSLGIVAGVGALAALLAAAFSASAKTKPKGVPPAPEDPYSKEACEDYKKQRQILQGHKENIQADIYEMDAQRMEAYQNGNPALGQQIDAHIAGQKNALSQVNAQIASLNQQISNCD